MIAEVEPQQQTIARTKELLTSFQNSDELFREKRTRARTDESYEKWDNLQKKYSRVRERAHQLIMKLVYPKLFGDEKYYNFDATSYQCKLERKAEGKTKFETLHRFGVWFMQASLSADYGTFTCDKCGYEFYHSPSTIYLGVKEVYKCCCGHCTNTIIYRDHRTEPYS